MASDKTSIDTAIGLMKMALAHLDEAREVFAAADLQQAIDTAEGKPNASLADDEGELVALLDALTGER